MYQFGPNMNIIHVSGESGARGCQIPPNSSVIVLDDSAPLIWLIQTDMAGYKTKVLPYSIEPYEIPKPIDPKLILERLDRLEEKINESNKYDIKTESKQQSPKQQYKP